MALVGVSFFATLLADCRSVPSTAEGRVLYESNGCGSCHGLDGRGDGPAAASLQVKPTDLRDPSKFLNGSGEEAIANTLLNGVAIHHEATANSVARHDRVMPAFHHLSEKERRSIALYLISLRTSDQPKKTRQ